MSAEVILFGRKAREILIVIALAGAASLAAGCGGDSGSGGTTEAGPVDVTQIENQLKKILSRPGTPAIPGPIPGQTVVAGTPALVVKSVNCPDNVEPKQGNEFRCKVSAGEATGDVEVTQKDDQGKVFHFNAKLKRPEVTITTKGTLHVNPAATG